MTAENQSSATGVKSQAPRIRSVAYPSLAVADCIDLANRIYKIFGNITYTPRESIAKQLHISESHLQTQVSSCVQFGLLELKSKEGYRPTELVIKLRNPLPDEKIEDIHIAIFSSPDLYKELIAQFNGKQIPQEAGLATILFRKHKVAEKVADFAARIFIQSAIELSFLKDDGVLNVASPITQVDLVDLFEDKKNEQPKKDVLYLAPATKNQDGDIEILPFFLDNGSVAKLTMPKGFTKDDLKRIVKVLNGYFD